MKKIYMQPTMHVAKLQHTCHILQASEVGGNAALRNGGGGSGPARARGFYGWDDDEEDYM